MEYGPDYWQWHYFDLPEAVQNEAAAHYDLTIHSGVCYTPTQRSLAVQQGLLHKRGTQWTACPGPTDRARRTRPPTATTTATCTSPPTPPTRRGPGKPHLLLPHATAPTGEHLHGAT